MAYQITQTSLRNGTRVILAQNPNLNAVTFMVGFGAGSRNETGVPKGTAHCLEHLTFRGTKRLPNQLAIETVFDHMGADSNASTWFECTNFYATVPAKCLPTVIDAEYEAIYGSLLRHRDIRKETLGPISEEALMYLDDPESYSSELFHRVLFGRQTQLGVPIVGTPKTVATIRQRHLLSFRRQHYVPANTVIILAGQFDPDEVIPRLEATFGQRPPVDYSATVEPPNLPRQPRQTAVYRRDLKQVNLNIGFPGLEHNHPDEAAMEVLVNVLGGRPSSRLFRIVRIQSALVYRIMAFAMPFIGAGEFRVETKISPKGLMRVANLILTQLAKLRKEPVSEKELALAKDNLDHGQTVVLIDPEEMADDLLDQILMTGRVVTPEQYTAKIRAVRPDDVLRVAQTVIQPERCVVVGVGPVRDLSPIIELAQKKLGE
ncbi:MAG: pitrilysin family protein [Patescibacteria group bacterium]|nr:pitrilysin family protein [Patescibacteria group bacterium]